MKRLSEIRDFNSYLNTENDRTIPARSPEPTHFNSRSLCRKRQLFVSVKVWYPIFQSTFPMQGTTSMRLISKTICLQFQSTFPMQGTTSDMQRLLRHKQFQSTFPMQGSTVRAPSERVQRPDFNPRSQCRERLQQAEERQTNREFQTTFPMQGTTPGTNRSFRSHVFQSTFPMQGTTVTIGYHVLSIKFQSTFPMQGTTL